jgi:UDP-N-acetylmuramoyl-L-alanyl-D-glutamate--2,6-diaminopimelate ligase
MSASIGTLGYISAAESRYGSLTTPDAISLHQMLDSAAVKGVTHLAMEASSHGLDLHRLDSVHLKAGGFTNLSRDHLDYHLTLESYFAAKQRLFTTLLQRGYTAVLNSDIPEFETLVDIAQSRGLKVISYGKKSNDIKLISANPQACGQILTLDVFGARREILLPVIGTFQALNSLCALGLVIGSGGDSNAVTNAIASLTGVPGRLQFVGETKTGGSVYVDYAHKPDALEQVLTALRPHVAAHNSKLGVVFGCGGNRDAGKRPIMGDIAARLADWAFVTDDNPRYEDAVAIRRAVMAGAAGAKHVREVADRAVAIEKAIQDLGQHDVLVIAGKGHESGQIIGDVTHPFDDAQVAIKVLG